MHRFSNERVMKEHVPYCQVYGPQKVKFPTEDTKWLQFDNLKYQLKVPFVIYGDFESILVKTDTCINNPDMSHTTIKNHHIPCGFSYVVINSTGQPVSDPVTYRGPDAADRFIQCLLAEEEQIQEIVKHVKPMIITQQQEVQFQKATVCFICNKSLGKDKVRDHCHLNGNYRGAAHNACNLQYKLTNKVCVVMHNCRGYDQHLLTSSIGKIKDRQINCIPNNMQKYVSFSLGNLHFLDSLQFLNASLDNLTTNLPNDKFLILEHFIQDEEKLNLALKKGVYPYTYMDSWEKFKETSLPEKSAFFNDLTGLPLTDNDYSHAQKVWETFDIQNLGEYHDFYVQLDILLLSDTFENFRSLCLNFYGLDCCHMYTAAGLSWQACLKIRG